MALTSRQAEFVRQYLIDLNAAAAARRAGYAGANARKVGYALLQKPEVEAAIAKAMALRAGRVEASADRTVNELARLAYADITDAVTWGDAVAVKDAETGAVTIAQGIALVPADKLPPHMRSAIAEVSQTRDGLKIKMHSKTAALGELARHFGLYAAEKHEHTGKGGGPIETKVHTPDDVARKLAAFVAEAEAKAKQGKAPTP